MARCYSCQKKLGLFKQTFVRTVDEKRVQFCEPCIELWTREQKERAVFSLCEGGDPVALFMIPRVRALDPDDPTDKEHLGHLIFADKAVCFVQVAEIEHQKPWEDPVPVSLGGALGAAARESLRKKARKEAWAQAKRDTEARGRRRLREILEEAAWLIMIPRQEITDIKHTWASGLRIESGKEWELFILEHQKKTYKQFEPKIRDYLSH